MSANEARLPSSLSFRPSDFTAYSDVIRAEYAKRVAFNEKYSLRAFATDIGLSFPRLSQVMNRKSGLSLEAAKKVAAALEMETDFKDFFLDLVVSQHARSETERAIAEKRLKSFLAIHPDDATSHADSALSEWHHLPILELISLSKGEIATERLADILAIRESDAQEAIELLLRNSYLKYDSNGRLQKCSERLVFNSSTPSRVIKEFHAAILQRASEAVFSQDNSKRKSLSTLITVQKSKINEARKFLEAMEAEFRSRFDAGEKADALYCLTTQLFEIAQHENKI